MEWYGPKHVERIVKMKSNHKNFVHFVGLYTYYIQVLLYFRYFFFWVRCLGEINN